MKTKIFCLLAALACAVAMLASCGGGNDTPPGGGGGNGEYDWNQTPLIFELSENSSKGELTSEVKRYYAGDYNQTAQQIDKLVKERNENAETTTNVKITYDYTPKDTDEFGWGANVTRINGLVKSGGSKTPDMFCNFAYDLTCAALKDSFANLYSTSGGNGNNYFEFTKEGYNPTSDNFFDSEAGGGYFFEYMKSLSLSDDKMYCLASNYCTDLVRAFLVVPVNVNMMNSIDVEDSTGDFDGDETFTIADFYELVWDGGFTYDAIAILSEGVTADTNASGEPDFGDKLGFAAGVGSGLTASGLLYTSSVRIINKVADASKATGYAYSYPSDNERLGEFADALNGFFDNNGVVTVSSNQTSGYLSELDGIRHSFAENNILFGGIIAVGSLEDNVYQEMRDGDGFGIAPIPLYKASTPEDPQQYLTLVHNIARIVAISKSSAKFEQCSAYLNYQSTHSTEIINEYYENKLGSAVNSGAAGGDNVKMLTYIRNHVRDCFDKTYEDAISRFKIDDTTAMNNRWHMILANNNYQVEGIRNRYKSLYPEKQGFLADIVAEWEALE